MYHLTPHMPQMPQIASQSTYIYFIYQYSHVTHHPLPLHMSATNFHVSEPPQFFPCEERLFSHTLVSGSFHRRPRLLYVISQSVSAITFFASLLFMAACHSHNSGELERTIRGFRIML
ncbi:hypothetical protein BO82DRAFT_211427 [Aspergillus uvarum CBS 121591]|uniref:Uncharacterized protein n=1 Tax=Aspergillus uvarum CBS 121591 TaxID=1448315 RepID=A0A319CPG0_9EURO|nr:hypothetical protein BO82DRAFT_211427 [Aspergillus uvarum CBS 121591]PYH84847.1 hypothetical protein BO82DRAFT_211427 [Aspergillus uvarum CBS 121591]